MSIYLILSFLFFSSSTLLAKKVDLNSAKQVALNLFSEKSYMSKNMIEIKETIPVYYKDELVFRIFNFYPNGFVIVSAEDNTIPILGYGTDINFSFEEIPPGLNCLLDEFKKEIAYAKKNEIKPSKEISEKWNTLSSSEFIRLKSYTPGTHLVHTTWGQRNSFNDQCPYDPVYTGIHCDVGCNAVALGQLLYKWGCPVYPHGTSSYTPANFTHSLTVNFGNQSYDWDSMSPTSADSENEKLLYHCGVACKVDYAFLSTTGPTENIKYALENYFGFETDGIENKSSYSPSTWISMLKSDLDNEYPIIYRGVQEGESIGHAWVIDGYNASNEFYCNWGWYGNYNNFYPLTALGPDEEDYYNDNQKAIFGIHPEPDFTISGPSIVCTSGDTFTVNVLNTALFDTILWIPGDNLTVYSGQYTTSAVIKATGDGISGLNVKLIKDGCDEIILSKYLWAGTPVITGLDGPTYVPTDEDTRYYPLYGYQIASPTNFMWIVSPSDGVSYDSYGWSTLVNYTYPDTYQIIYRGLNTCGWGDWYYSDNIYVYSSRSLVIMPNPSSVETTISIESGETALDETAEWELEVYDNVQNLKEKKTKLKGKSTTINTQSWKEGVYVIRAVYKDEILTGKLVVKK